MSLSFRGVWGLFVVLFTFCSASFISFIPAHAAPDAKVDSVSGAMCNGYRIFNGPIGKTFAVFAIVALGVGFFLGKVSWGTAIAIALGVGALFGAPALVQLVTGGKAVCAKNTTQSDTDFD